MTQFDDAAIAADYDDTKIDEFASAMKVKMAKKRDEGRDGWDDPAQCSVKHLANLLLAHIAKGDPVDIANFCMMLFHRRGAKAIQQAARDHYAPKLTEKEAVKIMADAIYKDCFPSGCGDDLEYDAFSKDAKVGIASIRAAGMRFKEEA
jgi:hypothetical protein